MQKLVLETEFDFSPEVIAEASVDQEFLDHVAANVADVVSITIEEDIDIDDKRRKVTMKYEVDPPVPGFLQKLVPDGNKSMTMVMEMDKEALTTTMKMIPSFMADKVKGGGRASFTQKGDKWVQRIEMEVEVKVKLIGGKIEKFVLAQMEDSMRQEFALMNEYLKKKKG